MGKKWFPALAAPAAVIAHIVCEALAGRAGVFAVAAEPSHRCLLALAFLLLPLWFAAVRVRALALALFGFVASSLLFEGNGLGAGAMLAALLYAVVASWLAARAIDALSGAAPRRPVTRAPRDGRARCFAPGRTLDGPYFAFVSAHGNRPPPFL